MNKKNLFIVLTFLLGIVILTQCNQKNCERKCKVDFFEKQVQKDTSEVAKVFRLGRSTISNGKCKLEHEFTFWRGGVYNDKLIPYIHLKGSIYKLGGAVYFELDSGNSFKYMDFDMFVGQSEPITFFLYSQDNYSKMNIRIQWKYDLVLDDKFLDQSIKDTIYKFRFSNLNIQMEETDMVLYMSKNYGMIGGYHANLLDDGSEEMFSSIGNIYSESDKKHIRRSNEGKDFL